MGYTPPPNPSPTNVKPENVLFLDIETVRRPANYSDLSDHGKQVFQRKFLKDHGWAFDEGREQELFEEQAAFFAEWNQIVCVSLGVFSLGEEGQRIIRVKSFFGRNEAIILDEVAKKLGGIKPDGALCAHNGKRFDFPLLSRKFLIHGKPLPFILQTMGIKPWESRLFDTMEMWQFNDSRSYISLDALAFVLGLPSPKGELDGSKVSDFFHSVQPDEGLPWDDKSLQPIATYCEGDIVTMANSYLKMIGLPIVKPEDVVIV